MIVASDVHTRRISSIDVFMDYVVFADSTRNILGVYPKWGNYTVGALDGANKPVFIQTSRGVKSVAIKHQAREKKPASDSKTFDFFSFRIELAAPQKCTLPSVRSHGTLAKIHGKFLASLAKILP